MSELKDLKKEIILIIKNIIDTLDQHFNSRSGTLLEILGGDCLPVTADDLRYRLDISNIAIEHMNFDKLLKAGDDDDIKITRMLLQDIKKLTIVTRDMHAANLFNNPNAHKSIVNIYSFIEFYVADIQRKIGSPDLLSLNAQSKRRYEKLLETISKVELEANGISEKSKIIIDAYNIAEDLPATSGELKSAKKLVDDSLLDITLKDKEAKKSLEEVQKTLSEIQNSQKVTESLVESFNKKYAAFTSTGLAAAFALRAKERKLSVQKWTLLLIFSLTICGFIGAERFPLLLQTLGNKTDFVTVFINMFYGFLSMAPAIWLAWISSAQIGMNYLTDPHKPLSHINHLAH